MGKLDIRGAVQRATSGEHDARFLRQAEQWLDATPGDDLLATLERLADTLDRLDAGAVERVRLVALLQRIVARVDALADQLNAG